MLINLSGDPEILEDLANDDKFIGVVLDHIVVRIIHPHVQRSVAISKSSNHLRV